MPSDLIHWKGGKNPVPFRKVRVVFRGSNTLTKRVYLSSELDWSEMRSGPQIVAYVLMETQP